MPQDESEERTTEAATDNAKGQPGAGAGTLEAGQALQPGENGAAASAGGVRGEAEEDDSGPLFVLTPVKILVLVLIALVLVVVILELFVFHQLEPVIKGVLKVAAGLGYWGVVVFFALYTVLLCTSLPVWPLLIGGVATFINLYGMVQGYFLTVAGAFAGDWVGSQVMFFVARFLFSDTLQRAMRRYRNVRLLDKAIERDAIRVLFLLRLSPATPCSVSYVLGASTVTWSDHAITTCGTLLGVLIHAWFGLLAVGVAEGASGGHVRVIGIRWNTWKIVAVVIAALLSVALIAVVVILIRKALKCAQGNHQQRIDGQRQQQPRKHPSVQLGDLLLRGWTMLGEHCPNCQEVPLMRHPRSGLEWCVQCEKEKEKEEAQTTNASCHDETQEISGGRATHDRQAADNGIIYHRHHQPQPQHGGRKEEDRKEKETKQSEKAKEGAETEREKENLSMMEQKSAMDQKGEERGRQRNRSEGEQHQAQPLQPSSRLVNVSSSEALESTRKLLEDRILVYATELSKCSHMDFDRDESILSIMEKACALLRSPPFRYPSQ
uniref:VTT domain-containing protein n=1 Tax=Chromera velia CCMP2878 TaxID=1169474 RepID=A0A0G4FRT1_9ALVE|eukprot:Cvel_18441.t1-p1 / transcript=Cvel_18441.t1 / gene=Cvel_18441 / organism=Chromera_velia_CCMP2878 / gene_product=TVP38/TMEM64 family membrane protein slr0305, putative / transcript_product=TVP38/TMEM64 family membrane protein slr0305, putative / location=Cvel_scaffold1527:27473-39068(+) / protein_length=549 / sequence_SO=supercontig / SO=protein_coding / is_pseudo=false